MTTTAFNILKGMKEGKSKLAKLTYDKLGLQEYLSDSKISIKHKKLAFQFRTHMIRTASNFGSKDSCPLGCDHIDNQESLLTCDIIKMNNFEVMTSDIKYDDVFGENSEKIGNAVSLLDKALRTRETLLQ